MRKIFYIFFIFYVLLFTFAVLAQQPTIEWSRTYNSPSNGVDQAVSIVLDSNRNVITAGTDGEGGYRIIKYSNNGQQLWNVRYFENVGFPLVAKKVVIDTLGNVYVTGYNESIVTVKFNSMGILQWVRKYTGNGSFLSEPHDLKIDKQQFIYLTGESTEPYPSSFDYVTIKYNSNGDSLWTRKYNGPSGRTDQAQALVVDTLGNVYVTGGSESLHDTIYYPDVTTIKYNQIGNIIWVSRYLSPNTKAGYSYDIALDNLGSLYTCGFVYDSTYKGFLLKYNNEGIILWNNVTDSITQTNGIFKTRVDYSNNVYFTGSNNYPPGNFHIIKYNSLGNILYEKSLYPTPPLEALLSGIYIDHQNNIYATGFYYTVKYDSSGVQKWKLTNYISNSYFWGNSLLVDNLYNIYICGNYFPQGINQSDFITLKYNQIVGIQPISNEIPNQYFLSQNYPNPFNPNTTIQFQLPVKTQIKVVVYDVLGKEMEKLANEELTAGTYKINFDGTKYSSGIYFYSLITDKFIQTKKMLMVK